MYYLLFRTFAEGIKESSLEETAVEDEGGTLKFEYPPTPYEIAEEEEVL